MIHTKDWSGLSKLACARQNAAAINPNRKVEIHAILQSQTLRSELGAAVERHPWRYRVIFRNAVGRYALRETLVRHGLGYAPPDSSTFKLLNCGME